VKASSNPSGIGFSFRSLGLLICFSKLRISKTKYKKDLATYRATLDKPAEKDKKASQITHQIGFSAYTKPQKRTAIWWLNPYTKNRVGG
jgi:hypothetical protein